MKRIAIAGFCLIVMVASHPGFSIAVILPDSPIPLALDFDNLIFARH